ncbi:MAG: hypothetical protein JWO31_2134 [Phycisphaerales bacterium]|nr:hypothetical protein [Phycisphaerales bacterium]
MRTWAVVALACAAGAAWPAGGSSVAAAADVHRGDVAPDFPPGAFADGGRYRLADFKDKVVVLFFYEKECPTCRGSIPARNQVVDQFKGRPVKFIAVAPGDTLSDVNQYARSTRLKMTGFSDLFGVMQTRYGFQISLHNIYQFRIVGPDGKVTTAGIDLKPADIEAALATAKWRYKDGGYHASLATVIDQLEWHQYEPALRVLRPSTKAGSKAVMESAAKLLDAVRAEAKEWVAEAATAAAADPVRAYDLYARVAACFPGEDLGTKADAAAMALVKAKPVADELAARKLYDGVYATATKAQLAQKAAFGTQIAAVAKKYPETPTGKSAAAFADELGRASAE